MSFNSLPHTVQSIMDIMWIYVLTHMITAHTMPTHTTHTHHPHTPPTHTTHTQRPHTIPAHRPSTNQILQLGTRVMFTCSERCSDNVNIFADMTQPSWDLDTVKYFTPFPTCGGYKQEQWYIVGGESQVVGPICE